MASVLKVATDSAFLVRRDLSRSLSDGTKPPVDVVSKLKKGGVETEHAEVRNAKDSVPKDEEFQKKEYHSSNELVRDELKRELANFKVEMRDEIKKLATEAKLDVRAEKLAIRDNLVDWKKDEVNRVDQNYGKLCGRIEGTKTKIFKYLIVGVVITTLLLK